MKFSQSFRPPDGGPAHHFSRSFMSDQNIAVVGAGAWGTALSLSLLQSGNEVDLWVYEKDLCALINQTRENKFYLPGISLPKNIHATSAIETAVKNKSVVVLVVPTPAIRSVVKELNLYLKPDCLIINAGKGIENETLLTPHQILKEVLTVPHRCGALSGPTFAAEVSRNAPSAIVAAAETLAIAEQIQAIFSTPKMKVFTSTDLIGVELGGALKNVIAIATGISDGLKLGHNARAALITRGLVEITRIGTALGARPETFSGLSGVGDLVLTCTGDLSRNRTVGLKLAQGEKLKEIVENMKMVAEGVRTVKSAHRLKTQLKIQASIIDATYQILYEDKPPKQALKDLMSVEISSEFSGIKGLQ